MSQTHTLTADDYGVLANADAAADGAVASPLQPALRDARPPGRPCVTSIA
jgi:hypothetical protein